MSTSKLLILGGTQFIGRNLVQALIESGEYAITLFNRQKTAVNLFPNVPVIKGDRETDDVQQIAAQHWDVVIDCSCYYPADLERVLDNLASKPKQYVFISTCSVYDSENMEPLKDESARMLSCTTEQRSDRTNATYGNRKIACEQILKASGIPHTILRPALVYGPHDHTDRFYYWLYQVKKNNPILLPDRGERRFSISYVHDLVAIIIFSIKNVISSTYNIISQPQTSILSIIQTAQKLLNTSPTLLHAPANFLLKENVAQWTDMPLWINGDHFTYTNQKLLSALNINLSDFEASVLATIQHYDSIGWPEPKYGMTEERRQELMDLV